MAAKKRKRRSTSVSYARLDAFCVGGIAALQRVGYKPQEIVNSGAILKPDGSNIRIDSVNKTLAHLNNDSEWRGERQEGSGRTRSTTPEQDQEIVDFVKQRRGQEKVTASKVKRALGLGSTSLVKRRLQENGLKWLRRRAKCLVPVEALEARLLWATWVISCTVGYLRRMVYTDGCSFYLDRTAAEVEHSSRAALGKYVYRMEESTDSLYKDCVGPSRYKKSQGEAVRIWGLLVDGTLHVQILERGTVMNRWEYAWIIKHRFPKWLGQKSWPLLVQDHEKCLWTKEPEEELERIGVQIVEKHPKYSPDLNAIENAWSYLRARLDDTHPISDEPECRDDFLKRLRNAITWVNNNRRRGLLSLCRNQKERAADVRWLEGHRTWW